MKERIKRKTNNLQVNENKREINSRKVEQQSKNGRKLERERENGRELE